MPDADFHQSALSGRVTREALTLRRGCPDLWWGHAELPFQEMDEN